MPPKLDHDGEEGDELWIMSYADMVTLLFGFFVILYSFSTLDDKKFDQMTEKVAEAFKSTEPKKRSEHIGGISEEARQTRAFQMLVSMLNLGDTLNDAIPRIERSFSNGKSTEQAKKLLLEKAAGEHKEIVAQAKKSDKDNLQIVELILPASTLFPSGGYQLSQKAVKSLQDLAQDLRRASDLAEIEILGHTDSQPPSRNPVYSSNLVLSALRAGEIATVLTKYGVSKDRISVRGMGDQMKVAPEFDKNGRPILENMAKNRRVSILLKMRPDDAPMAH